MGETPEQRCPHCNGTGMLPTERVRKIQVEQDEAVTLRDSVSMLWGELADLMVDSKKKSATIESLRNAIAAAYKAAGKMLTLDMKTGKRPE